MKQSFDIDTIVAVATPPGEGGIAIIRISGPESFRIVSAVFHGTGPVSSLQRRYANLGLIKRNDLVIDEVILTLFPHPESYTGEDVAEISCHGGTYVSRTILDLVVEKGARIAEPGEFTKRAFLNGRMDLAQAEAVADLIRAKTEASRRVSFSTLQGRMSDIIRRIRQELIDTCSYMELELDFSEEDILISTNEKAREAINKALTDIEKLIGGFSRGRVCRDGVRLVIVGKTNVGKSSILNVLLERERAIVTHIPGTTRDLLEEIIDVEGICFIVTDTAGIRQTSDPIEKEGVRLSRQALAESDVILLVLDGSNPLDKDDVTLLEMLKKEQRPVVIAINKKDLGKVLQEKDVRSRLAESDVLYVSALQEEGISALIQVLKKKVLRDGLPSSGEALITQVRQYQALARARKSIIQARETLNQGLSEEFVAMDVRAGLDALGEITGEIVTDEVLNNIFSRFCVGK